MQNFRRNKKKHAPVYHCRQNFYKKLFFCFNLKWTWNEKSQVFCFYLSHRFYMFFVLRLKCATRKNSTCHHLHSWVATFFLSRLEISSLLFFLCFWSRRFCRLKIRWTKAKNKRKNWSIVVRAFYSLFSLFFCRHDDDEKPMNESTNGREQVREIEIWDDEIFMSCTF